MEDKELFKLLSHYMPADQSPSDAPDPLLVWEARLTVAARKKTGTVRPLFEKMRGQLLAFISPMQAGLATMMLVCCYLFIIHDNSSENPGSSRISQGTISESVCNTTISVMSSTMLTSIPTLRN